MTKAVDISKKEQNRREKLYLDMREEIVQERPGDWDPLVAFEDYYKEGLTLEQLTMSAINRLDFSMHHELDKLRNTIFDIKKELNDLIKHHKHTRDGSACKPI